MKEPICANPCPDVPVRGMPQLAIAGRLRGIIEAFLLWLERGRQRRRMHQLSNHMLRDIGLSRADVEVEFQKKSWHR